MSNLRYFILFFVCWAISLIIYSSGTEAHFIFDFNMWALNYQKYGWHGIPITFTDGSMHHAGHVLPFLLCRMLGYNSIAWTLALTALHSINALLLYICVRKTLRFFEINNADLIALFSTLLFLFSPLHTEVVVWASAVWYLQVTALILLCIIWLIDNLNGSSKSVFLYYLFLLLAFFTWEIAFCIPFLVFLVLLFSRKSTVVNLRLFSTIVVPSFLCIGLYMLLNKLRTGALVSHYGAAQHLRFPLSLIMTNTVSYLLKLSTINAFISYHQRDAIYQLFANDHACLILMVACGILGIGVTYLLRRKSEIRIAWLFFLMTLAALIPVINIYMVVMKDIEQDRYLYVASAFFYVSLVLVVFSISSGVLRYGLIVAFAVLLLCLQHRFVHDWQTAGRSQNGLVSSFRWTNAKRIVILSCADNVNGAYCLRSQPYSSFGEALQAHTGINVRDRIIEAIQFNMLSPSDSMHSERIDSMAIKTTFAQAGNWLWKNGYLQNDSVETPDCKVYIDKGHNSFITTMKNRKEGDIFIYQVGDHWVQMP